MVEYNYQNNLKWLDREREPSEMEPHTQVHRTPKHHYHLA